MNNDQDHLRILSVFHFIFGGLAIVFSFFALIYVALGAALVGGMMPQDKAGNAPPPEVGWFLIALGAIFFIMGLAYGINMIVAGLKLRRQRSYVFCMIMASLTCLQIPLGTCLGIFTIVVLARPSVKSLFEREKARVRDLPVI